MGKLCVFSLAFCCLFSAIFIPVGFLSVYFAVSVETQQEYNVVRDDLNGFSKQIISNYITSMEQIEYNLRRTASVINSTTLFYPASNFTALTLLENIPDANIIDNIFYLPHVLDVDRPAYENFGNESVTPDYTITDFRNGTYVRVENRTEYYPILGLVPFFPILYGLDFLRIDVINDTIADIREQHNTTGNISLTITEPFSPIDDDGIITFRILPIFAIGDNPEVGIVVTVISINNIIRSALPEEIVDKVDIYAFDGNTPILFRNDTEPDTIDDVRRSFRLNTVKIDQSSEFDLEFANQVFHVIIVYDREFIESMIVEIPTILLISLPTGIFIMGLVIYLFMIAIIAIIYSILTKSKEKAAQVIINYVNHEIRNPLNIIHGMLDKALDSFDDDDELLNSKECIKSNLNTAYNATFFIGHLCNDMLDIQKISNGKLKINPQITCVGQFIDDVCKMVTPKFEEKGGAISLRVFIYNRDDEINIDIYRIKQILLNLIINAVKFTDEGSISLIIERYENNGKDLIKFSIKDTGRGIPQNRKHTIFRPFEQVSITDDSKYGGFGLGLYLCKSMIEAMSGHIDFDSREGIGTTFWFTIPNVDTSSKNLISPLNELNWGGLSIPNVLRREASDMTITKINDIVDASTDNVSHSGASSNSVLSNNTIYSDTSTQSIIKPTYEFYDSSIELDDLTIEEDV